MASMNLGAGGRWTERTICGSSPKSCESKFHPPTAQPHDASPSVDVPRVESATQTCKLLRNPTRTPDLCHLCRLAYHVRTSASSRHMRADVLLGGVRVRSPRQTALPDSCQMTVRIPASNCRKRDKLGRALSEPDDRWDAYLFAGRRHVIADLGTVCLRRSNGRRVAARSVSTIGSLESRVWTLGANG